MDDSVPVERPGELFGLQSAESTSWNFGINVHPNEMLALGANYGIDTYDLFQVSRNANPPPDPTWTDPNRNWNLDGTDEHQYVQPVSRPAACRRNTDIRFGYDLSDSNNAFVHGGPRIDAGRGQPVHPVARRHQHLAAGVGRCPAFLNNRVGIGVGWASRISTSSISIRSTRTDLAASPRRPAIRGSTGWAG